MNAKSLALGKKKMGSNHERRSSAEPVSPKDKKLSKKHLADSVEFNMRHARDHEKLEREDMKEMRKAKTEALKKVLKGSIHYNRSHTEKHLESAKEDRKLLHKDKEA